MCAFCQPEEMSSEFIRVLYLPHDPAQDGMLPVHREWQKRIKTVAALLECEEGELPSMNVVKRDETHHVVVYRNPRADQGRPAVVAIMSLESGEECSLPSA